MYDLSNFKLSDAASCSMALRKTNLSADYMEDVAETAVRFLYENLLDETGNGKACALVRLFKTHSYDQLSEELKAIAQNSLGNQIKVFPGMQCMVLLGTAGDLPEWNDRKQSANHQVIPLPSPKIVSKMPMVSQLLTQLNFSISSIVKPATGYILEPDERKFGIFFIPNAKGSRFIPDQESFVEKYNIESVIGFGAMLPSNNMFSTVIFSRVAISEQAANLFKTCALSMKVALVPFDGLDPFRTNLKNSANDCEKTHY